LTTYAHKISNFLIVQAFGRQQNDTCTFRQANRNATAPYNLWSLVRSSSAN
jgi:hypothetical protein